MKSEFISKSDAGSISWYMVVSVEGLYDKNCLLVGMFPLIVIFSTISSSSQTTSCTGSKPVMDLDSFIYAGSASRAQEWDFDFPPTLVAKCRTMDRTDQGVPPAATTAARGISLARVRARTADTDSWTKVR